MLLLHTPKFWLLTHGGDVIHPQLRKVGSGYETTAAMQEKNYCTGCGTEKIVKWLSSQREVASWTSLVSTIVQCLLGMCTMHVCVEPILKFILCTQLATFFLLHIPVMSCLHGYQQILLHDTVDIAHWEQFLHRSQWSFRHCKALSYLLLFLHVDTCICYESMYCRPPCN